ncbi:MAG: methyltransferase [Candidatus Hodarchaeota archaeon]
MRNKNETPRELFENLESGSSIREINFILQDRTGIVDFFRSIEHLENFKEQISGGFKHDDDRKKDDMGDFQTPMSLVNRVCKILVEKGFNPSIIIEPTVGIGNFIIAALNHFPGIEKIYCIELQEAHEWIFKRNLLEWALSTKTDMLPSIEFYRDNIFTHQFPSTLLSQGKSGLRELLILGNPPWMTNTELSLLDSNNVPEKRNVYNHKGIDAITGKGNFDIGEAVVVKILENFLGTNANIAMLCKTTVIRNIIKGARKKKMSLSNIKSIKINAKKEFGINADASLFIANLRKPGKLTCDVSKLDSSTETAHSYGWVGDKFVSNVARYEKYKYLDGISPIEWRQGVKHDAIKVMVLDRNPDGSYTNGLRETVDLEDGLMYPFLRGVDLKGDIITESNKFVLITQKKLNQDTSFISKEYPKAWAYLEKHGEQLDGRKSKIYKGKNRFSIFGIGDYAFKPYKVGIAGLYKDPSFSLIHPISGKPAMLDDTCYFLHFEDLKKAKTAWKHLNSSEVGEFLKSIAFLDAKRPFKKEILSRVDLGQLM